MSIVQIPLTTAPNQTFNVVLPINNINKKLTLNIRYMSDYWVMDIIENKVILVSSLPLIMGDVASGNILGQFQHLNIGSACIVKASDISTTDADNTNLGTDFLLLWGDNIG